MLGFDDDLMNFSGFIHYQKKAQFYFYFYFFTPLKMSPSMTCKFNSFFEFSHMYTRENNEDPPIPQTFPLANASLVVHLDPEDIILPVADDHIVPGNFFEIDDPEDFIIELGNECEDLQYIAEKTNELFNTEYTEDDVQRIINEFIEAITE